MVELVDFFLARTDQNVLAPHYFSNSGAAYPGECSPGLDDKLMEWCVAMLVASPLFMFARGGVCTAL
jgi:hypothetical protein